MGAPIHSAQDTYSKLHDTIIMYKDEPYRVSVNPHDVWNNMVSLRKIGSRDPAIIVDHTDPYFNYTKFNLGYINSGDGAYYIKRSPYRQYRSGLCLRTFNPSISSETFYGKAMREMLLQHYPSFTNALKAVKDRSKMCVAFDPMYAVKKHVEYHPRDDSEMVSFAIEYKNTIIANLMDDGTYLFKMGCKHQLHIDNLAKHGLVHTNGAKA